MKKFLITLVFSMLVMFSLTMGASADSIAVEFEDFDLYGGYTVGESPNASGGKYMSADTTNPGPFKKVEEVGPVQTEYNFSIKTEGFYSIFLRLANPASYAGDSLYFALDEVLYETHFGTDHTDFYWKKVGIVKLEPGQHVTKIWGREAGGMVDKVVITSNPLFVPEGFGTVPEGDPVFYENGEGDLIAPLPATVPPTTHPRLLVRAEDLPKIRENLDHPQNAAVYQKVLELSKSTLDGKQGYNTNLYEVMQAKAFLYMVNGDVNMGRQAVDMVMNHIDTVDFGVTLATDGSQRNCGQMMFATSCVYDWCYDLFTPAQREHYISRCEDLATLNFEGGYPIVEFPDSGDSMSTHKSENPIFKDLLAFAIAIYDEKPFEYNNIVGLLYQNYFNWRYWIYPSHWMPYGVSTYGDFRMVWELFCTYMLDVLDQSPFTTNDQRDTMYKSIYWRRPDGHFMNDADEARRVFDNTYVKNDHAGYFIAGNMYKDPVMKWQYYKNKASTDYTAPGITGITAPMYLLMNDVDVALENRAELPLTKYYPSPAGVMFARTSWEEGADSPAVMVSMKPIENFFSGHAHVDIGHFNVYYKGMLAMDPGSYEAPAGVGASGVAVPGSQWGSGHYMNYLTAPVAHNVLIVYDQPVDIKDGGQRMLAGAYFMPTSYKGFTAGSNKTAENIAYDYGPDKQAPEYSYIESDLAPGYREDRVREYTRSYMFLNLFDDEIPAAFIVFDRMESTDKGFQKAWLLHSQEEPRVNGNQVTIDRTEWHNNGRLTNTVLMPQEYKIDKVGGPGYDYWDGVQNNEIYREPIGDESGAWRIEVKPAQKEAQDYFLNVMQVSDADNSIVHHQVTSNEQGEFVGVFIADRAVFLKKDAGQVTRDFTVTANGAGEISYIITNLAEGRWNVTDLEGNAIASEAIDEEHGVLRFRAAAGTYKVSWTYEENIQPKVFDILGDAKILDYVPVDMFVNSKYYNGEARLENGVVMLALEDLILETARSEYAINGDTFTVKGGYGEMSGTVGSTTAIINGQEVTLSVAPAIYDGKLYIPLDEILHDVVEYVAEYDELTHILYFRGGAYMVPGAMEQIVNVEDSNRADVINVTCSEDRPGTNDAWMSLDNIFDTYWTCAGAGQWITYELADTYDLTGVGLGWASGHIRQQHFAIHVSEDGENWTEMWRGDSSGTTQQIEPYMFDKPIKAKFVKLECNENTANMMNSLREAHIYCTYKKPYYEK